MKPIQNFCCQMVDTDKYTSALLFERLVFLVIFLNSISIGLSLSYETPFFDYFNIFCVGIYAIEVILKLCALWSPAKYFKDPSNIFDFVIVTISLTPDCIVEDTEIISVLRIVSFFKILRILSPEMKTIIKILIKSMSALTNITLLSVVFIYMFAVLGVFLFQMPTDAEMDDDMRQKYEQFVEESEEYFPGDKIDPYGDVLEAMVTDFKILGEGWSLYRSKQILAKNLGLIKTPIYVITLYHIIWFIFAAYLLLNLVVGAVLSNYEEIKSETIKKQKLSSKEQTNPDKEI